MTDYRRVDTIDFIVMYTNEIIHNNQILTVNMYVN